MSEKNASSANGSGLNGDLKSTFRTKVGLAEMLKGGVIMDVVTPEQAIIAEEAGACAVMALERVPSDIRREGGVARMTSLNLIKEIQSAVTIPVMAKVRIGHFVEAQILQELNVDFIDESEVLTPADDLFHIDKHDFRIPFVCGCRDLGEALRRIGEGAAMIRTKGEAGSGNIVEAVRHLREVHGHIRRLKNMAKEELMTEAKNLGRALRFGLRSRALGQTAGSQLQRGRCGDSGGRGFDDAIGRGSGFRRQRHFQKRRPDRTRTRHRGCDDAFQRRRKIGRMLDEFGRTDERPRYSPDGRSRQNVHARLVNQTNRVLDVRCFVEQETRL